MRCTFALERSVQFLVVPRTIGGCRPDLSERVELAEAGCGGDHTSLAGDNQWLDDYANGEQPRADGSGGITLGYMILGLCKEMQCKRNPSMGKSSPFAGRHWRYRIWVDQGNDLPKWSSGFS